MTELHGARTRPFTIIGQDPSFLRGGKIVRADVDVPVEELGPGPRGYRVSIVDYDATNDVLYEPADLGSAADGQDVYAKADDDRLLDDPGFHAQNVYAIVMRSLARFESALGRHVSWSFPYGHQIQVAPHAFREANAYYSERDQGLLFGYFPGRRRGETVFTCLSHDVVVHETAHALLDSLRDRYTDPSLPDQEAFHEGFADLVALLSIFSIPKVVEELIRASIYENRRSGMRGRPTHTKNTVDANWLEHSAVFRLAEQMAEGQGGLRGGALRSSLDIEPSRDLLERDEFQPPHRRGEVLVAATLTALVETWAARLEHLGSNDADGEQAKAISRIAEEGAAAADYLLGLAIRALDYTPPIDLLFGDYLSALLTADAEMSPKDSRFEFRRLLRKSFESYGIRATSQPRGDGLWQRPDADANIAKKRPLSYERVHFESMRQDPDEVFRFLWENRDTLGLYPDTYTRVMSVRPCARLAPDGFYVRETVAEYEQMIDVRAAQLARMGLRAPDGMPAGTQLRLHGGGTLIFDEFGRLKFNVHKRLHGKGQQQKLDFLWRRGGRRPEEARARSLGAGGYFADLHRRRSI